MDAYDRQKFQPDLADLYRALQWMYPDDPFVRGAYADWVHRHPDLASAPTDTSGVVAALSGFPCHAMACKRPAGHS